MATDFPYDVFLSHSSEDTRIVTTLAERLRADGLHVWLDKLRMGPGNHLSTTIGDGVERSRVLVLCMSATAFRSDWTQSEACIVLSRDPLNRERRFIPLLLDDAPIPDRLRAFKYIDWTEGMDFVASEILKRVSDLELADWNTRWKMVLTEPGRSERRVVDLVLEGFDDLLATRPFRPGVLREGMVGLVSEIIEQKHPYQLLNSLQRKIDTWFIKKPTAAEDVKADVQRFRDALAETLKALAAQGANVIESDDKILLYAYSESVHSAIEQWLHDHPEGTLTLVFCQCLWKHAGTGDPFDPFREAVLWADRFEHKQARIVFTTDAAVSFLIQNKDVNKVLFGAYHWHRQSTRCAKFANTPGTFAVAAVANKFDVPVFVIAEANKTQNHPSEESCRPNPSRTPRSSPPTQTVNGLVISFQDPGIDEVESKEIPFVLVTEDGAFPCADFDLRKTNRVGLDEDQLSVTKTTHDGSTALSERIALETLDRVGSRLTPGLQVPPIIPGTPPWGRVRMQRKAGVRLHDFVATLNELVRRGMDDSASRRAKEFRDTIRQWALEDVHTWQSPELQEPLKEAFGQELKPYEFATKLQEAMNYVWGILHPGGGGLPDQLLQDLVGFSQRLTRRAAVALRDASLKNQILELRGLLGRDQKAISQIKHFQDADSQWYDPYTAELILARIPDRIPWERVREHIWHVDFELASRLTTPEDDFIHVLALEIFNLDYDHIIGTIAEHLPSENPEFFHETMLFRCFRAWARRLSYARERPDTYATRYRHESLTHYSDLALIAIQHLQGEFGSEIGRLIHQVERTLVR